MPFHIGYRERNVRRPIIELVRESLGILRKLASPHPVSYVILLYINRGICIIY
jgi:hypothetical protein